MTGVAIGAMRDPDTLVAEGINWTVNAGDYWVVAGLHGSGKSDFLISLLVHMAAGVPFLGFAPPRPPPRKTSTSTATSSTTRASTPTRATTRSTAGSCCPPATTSTVAMFRH